MEEKIKEVIQDLFEKAPDTQEAKELQEEMISNAEEKYRDLIGRGFSEDQAYTMVMASIGDVQELLADLNEQETDEAENKRREYWEKNSEYWKWQSECLEEQARILGQQAKGAFASIMKSDIWENISSGVKQIIGGVGVNMQTDDKEYTEMTCYAERHFATDGITAIVAELSNSPIDLVVETCTDKEIAIQEWYNKEPQKGQTLEFTINDSKLKLQYSTNVFGLSRRGKIVIMLPEEFADTLKEFRAVTASGDVKIDKLAAEKLTVKTMSGDISGNILSGEVNVNTLSGDVAFDTIVGNCQVRTASGDIKIKNMTGTINQNSASGDVHVLSMAGNASFRTASGDIDVTVTETDEKLELTSASGDIDVALPANTSVQMTLGTSSGDITTFCDNLVTEEHVDYVKQGKNAVGTVGTEPFLQLKVTTASGDITITR